MNNKLVRKLRIVVSIILREDKKNEINDAYDTKKYLNLWKRLSILVFYMSYKSTSTTSSLEFLTIVIMAFCYEF